MAEFSKWLEILSGALGLAIIVFGVLLGIFVFFRTSPVVHIDLLSTRRAGRWIVCDFQIENKSSVRIKLDREGGILLQALNLDLESVSRLPRLLPFAKDVHFSSTHPASWREPERIFTSTIWLYPGARIQSQIFLDTEGKPITHFGVQVHALFGFPERWLFRRRVQRWTRVFIELDTSQF